MKRVLYASDLDDDVLACRIRQHSWETSRYYDVSKDTSDE